MTDFKLTEDICNTDFKLTEDTYTNEECLKAYLDDLVTDPIVINEEIFDEALNVLPPARWDNVGGVEMFFVIERYTHNLVNWYFKISSIEPFYFVCLDYDNKKGSELAEKALKAYNIEIEKNKRTEKALDTYIKS